MDYEKKYKESLKVAKEIHKFSSDIAEIKRMEKIFPELKESEDERIRKAIINIFATHKDYEVYFGVSVKDIRVWLEKQGEHNITCSEEQMKVLDEVLNFAANHENPYWNNYIFETLNNLIRQLKNWQKSANKVKPMFNVGEWVTNSIETVQITGYDIDYGYQVNYKGNLQHRDTDIIEKEYHLWTIQDAKNGDVLLSKHNQPFIYNGIFDEESVGAYCGIDKFGNDFLKDTFSCDWSYKEGVKPATKEQRELLFAKMKNAGYEFNFKEKELKKTNYQPRVADYEDFREWKDEKSEAEMVGMEDPVLQRLDKILDVLMEIKINTVLRQPYITSDPPQPIQPWYETKTVTCGEQVINGNYY